MCISGWLTFLSSSGVSFHPPCSLNLSVGVPPDPCALNYTNTLLFPNATLALRWASVREAPEVGGALSIISLMIAFTFISLRIKIFRTLAIYIKNSISRVSSSPYGVAFQSRHRWDYAYMYNITHRPMNTREMPMGVSASFLSVTFLR